MSKRRDRLLDEFLDVENLDVDGSSQGKQQTLVEPALTTIDNPHDPFNAFPQWYAWDEREGYHTSSFLARILVDGDDLSEYDQNLAYHKAIDEIVRENVSGLYKKVTRTVPFTGSY